MGCCVWGFVVWGVWWVVGLVCGCVGGVVCVGKGDGMETLVVCACGCPTRARIRA